MIKSIQKKVGATNIVQGSLIIIFYVALSVLVIGANPLRGETSAPMDVLLSHSGWASVSDIKQVVHPERSDVVDSLIPRWVQVKNTLLNGDSTLWMAGRAGGQPGSQVLSNGIYTPSFLMFVLFEDNWLGFYFSSLIKMIIAGVGAFLFLQFYLNRSSALFGGATFMLIGFHSAWLYWAQVSTSIWIPWLLWSVTGWLFYLKVRWLSAIVLTTVMLVLGGFPAVAAYGLYSAGILSLLLLLALLKYSLRKSLISLLLVFVCIAIAFMLVSIPLLGLKEMLSQMNLDYRTGGTWLKWVKDWQLFFNPYLYGLPSVERTLYSGLVATVLAVLTVVLLAGRKLACGKRRFIALYALLLLILSVGISFGLFSHELIRMIPAVGLSPWNRVVVIAGISMVVLSSVSFGYFVTQASRLKSNKFRMIAYGILCILVTAQILDQIKLFRAFNAIVSKDQFLPVPPSLKYIADNTSGLQSVIADNSYLMGGTLASYGIAEWFAHAFKTDQEKKLLRQVVKKPFASPTSARFSGSAIDLESSLLDKLGVAYITVNKSSFAPLVIRKQQSRARMRVAPPLPDSTLSQILNIEKAISFPKLGILLATYKKESAPADVRLQIISGGNILAESVIEASKVRDNKYAIFKFSERVFLNPGEYEVVIKLKANNVSWPITAWYVKKPDNSGDLIMVNGHAVQGSLVYRIYKENDIDINKTLWEVHDLEPKIRVLKNKDVPVGAYYISDFSADAPWSDSNLVTTFESSVSINIDFRGGEPGYIVLPMRYYPGWTATIDNKEVEIKKYLGVLPSVYVSEPAKIEYRYQPDWLNMGEGITLLGFLLFVLVLWVWRRYEKKDSPSKLK